jgi:ATPase family associated with various cellular activities (AAA)
MSTTSLPRTTAERVRPPLLAEVDRICSLLEHDRTEGTGRAAARARPGKDAGPVDLVAERLGLSAFERDLVLLLAAVQLDSEVAALVAGAQHGDERPTFALAMGVLPDPHWDALSPERPLRRWGVVELAPGPTLATRPLVLDEHLLHTVTGLTDGGRLGGLAAGPADPVTLTPTQTEIADDAVAAVEALDGRVLVRLTGIDLDARVGVATGVAEGLGLRALIVRDAALGDSDLTRAAMVLDREAMLADRLLVTGHDRLLPLLESPVVVAFGEAQPDAQSAGRTLVSRAVDLPTPEEQAALWAAAMPDRRTAEVSATTLDLAHYYRLTARSIAAIAGEWSASDARDAAELRRLTRERARVGLGPLAERIDPRASWDDLVLPEGQRELIRDLVRHVRHRARVYDDWGFGAQSARGLGITALFAGESGTGKTMAAEVIAGDLGHDLFRIDLSAVVSKYIGETEKNLRSVFDAAEAGGAVLLFDEADALFGKRSDVKDSHDRYANLEVAYLLQRMESYRGLAVLTTNLRSNVDRAFLRRLRFVVQFPFPDEAARAEIWRRVFPPSAPLADHEPEALAKLQVSGGSIRSIALAAAFSAAEDGTAIEPRHLLRAAQVEYAKAERTLTTAETAAVRGGGSR